MDRNPYIDYTRGIAALMVIMGHTLQVYSDAEQNVLYNIITSLQMPLFMMVSGFAVGYSKPINSKKTYILFVKKRSISLLVPWIVWTMIQYLLLSHRSIVDFIQYAAYHMESAFWFLFSLWTIDIIFAIVSYCCRNIRQTSFRLASISFASVFNCLILYVLAGCFVGGGNFLGLKYTSYYSLFFFAGYIYHHLETSGKLQSKRYIIDYSYPLFVLSYIIALSQFNIVQLPDEIPYIAIRLCVSFIGCWIVFYVVKKFEWNNSKVANVLHIFGKYSAELYVVQSIVILGHFVQTKHMSLNTSDGLLNFVAYFAIATLICFAIIKVLSLNRVSRLIFFGKII